MKNKKGFTLIELLAVIVIIGILALIIVPIVSNYIADTRKNTYMAHEATMKEAARSFTVECINGTETCTLPQEGQTTEIFLNELIDKSFAQRLQNPQEDGYCNSNLSYVRITNTGNSNFEYEACLYCGKYATESTNCSTLDTEGDSTKPTCGTVEGASSEWTNQPRTITVGCNDTGSGCLRNKFARTFRETTNNSVIEITDRAGNMQECPVSVRVDRTPPTCELQVLDATEEVNGWVSGPVKVQFKPGSRQDGQSGIQTYGIGTSSENVNYNRKELIDLTNINGVVTVIGYVKDNAGNEGTCSVNLRTGVQRPAFDIYYGYQIFPVKDYHTDSGLNVTSNNIVTTTSNNPTMTFNNMNKYKNVPRVVITFNSAVSNPTNFELSVDNGTAIKARPTDGNKRLEFDIPKGTYNKYVFKFGSQSGITYEVLRMEIQHTDNNAYNSKPITVNLFPDLSREKVKTDGYSFDNGGSFQTAYFKQFNSSATNNAQTKNDIPMYSDKKQFKVSVHTEKPEIVPKNADGTGLEYTPTGWTNGNVTITGKAKDSKAGLIAYAFSKGSAIGYDSTSWNYIDLTKNNLTQTHVVTVNGTYYFNIKSESGLTNNLSQSISNIDKIKPVCSVTGNSTVGCTDSTNTDDYGVSSIDKYVYAKNATTSSTFTTVTATNNLSVNVPITSDGTWNLYAKDRAGNISNVASYVYHSVTYKCNGGAQNDTVAYVREGTPILTNGNPVVGNPSCTKTGYTFQGWSKTTTATSKTTSLDMGTSDVTLYAVWSINNVGTPTISGAATKIYNTSTTTLTCTESTQYSSDTKKYYTFGYSTTDGGTDITWLTTSNEESNTATSSTYTIPKANYFGNRYWSCKVYAKNSYLTSNTGQSTAAGDQLVSLTNAKVTFNGNNGTVSGTSPAYTRSGQTKLYTSATGTTESAVPGATRSCYDFTGWYTAASGGSQIYNSSKTLSSSEVAGFIGSSKWTLIEDKNLYAHWNNHTFSISYNNNSGTAATSGVPTSYVYGTGTTINGTPTRSGYTFNGWTIGSTTAFSHTISTTACSDVSATAKWCANCNAGANASCTLTASTAGTCSYATSCSAHYHYTSGKNTATPACAIDSHTLTYDSDGGTACTATTANYGSTWGTLCSPTKTGYDFEGWYDGTTKVTSATTVSGDRSVKASWKASVVDPTVALHRLRGKVDNGAWCGKAHNDTVVSHVCQTCTGSCPCVIQAIYITAPSGFTINYVKVKFDTNPSDHTETTNEWSSSETLPSFQKYTVFRKKPDDNSSMGEVGVGTNKNFFKDGSAIVFRFRNENGSSGVSGKISVKYTSGAKGSYSFNWSTTSSNCSSWS